MRPAYRKRVGWPFYFHLAMLVPTALCLGGAVSALRYQQPGAALPLLAVGAVLSLIWWRMRHLDVSVSPDEIAYGFGGLNRKIPAERVLDIRIEGYSFPKYLGWGYRIGWKARDRGYTMPRHPQGLRVDYEDASKRPCSVYLSLPDPDEALAAFKA